MNTDPTPITPDAAVLLADVPHRLFTAIRSRRFYPPANPQVRLSRELLLSSIAEVRKLKASQDVEVALAENAILVCGTRLTDRESGRQQIQGLVNFFTQFNIHSFIFHSTFNETDCEVLLHLLADLTGRRELAVPVAELVEQARLDSVSVDTKRYVEVHGGEGLAAGGLAATGDGQGSADGLAAGKHILGSLQSLSRELVEELTGLPLGSELSASESENLLDAILEVLFNLDLEVDPVKRHNSIEESARTMGSSPPDLLARLLPQLSATPVGDAFFLSVIQELTPARLEQTVIQLESAARQEGDAGQQAKNTLSRLAGMGDSLQNGLRENLARHNDARELLASMHDDDVPPVPLQLRLQHPTWSASVLAAAAQQSTVDTATEGFAAFNKVLRFFEEETETAGHQEVIRQAALRISTFAAPELSGLLVRKFKGLFGEQLYEEILNQVSDILLDESIEHLTPKQLNRMVAVLVNDIPMQVGKAELDDLIPADSTLFKKLARTRQAPKIRAEIASQLDAAALQSPLQSIGDLPDGLRLRLEDEHWPARLLATSAMQATDPAHFHEGKADFSAHERMLKRYALLFDKDKLAAIAAETGSLIAGFAEDELGLLLMQPESTTFGEEIKEELLRKISAAQAERIALHLRKAQEGDTLPMLSLDDKALQEAYKKVQEQLRREKVEAIINVHQERKKKRQEEQIRQLKGGLEGLVRGEIETLLLKEVVVGAPEVMLSHLQQGQEEQADQLLSQLARGLAHNNPDIQANAAVTLASCSTLLVQEGQWQRLTKLLPALRQALRTPGLENEPLQAAVAALSGLGIQYLQQQRYPQAADAFHVLQMFSEVPEGGENIQRLTLARLARTALKEAARPEILESLFDQYLHSETTRDAAAQALISLGMESARYQIQQLLLSESRAERTRILHLIERGGKASVNALLEQLNMESPWFITRSIIRLLGELGNSPLFTAIQPFLSHADIRVQQEALQAGACIGGEYFKEFLLSALHNVDDSLKKEVIEKIIEVKDDRFVRPLCQLMRGESIEAAKNREELQLAMVEALEQIGSKRAFNALVEMGAADVHTASGSSQLSGPVREAAAQAAESLRLAGVAQIPATPEPGRTQAQPSPATGQVSAATFSKTAETVRTPEEEQFFRLIEQQELEKAKGLLLGLVSAAAEEGDFAKAEGLKHHLYSIEGMALREIIQAEELIEQAKQRLIPQEDLQIWEALHRELSTEEFQAVYHSFQHRIYAAEEPIVKQGERNDHLFFINQGSVKVSYSDGKKEVFVTSLNRGHVAGESFFTPSIWTVTLTALIRVQTYLLPRSAIISWEERFPGLRNKLLEYYHTFDNTWSFLERKKLERRKHERFNLTRKILVQPLNQQGYPVGRGFRAETLDISVGGAAFLVRIGRQENARVLLGRKMQVIFPVSGDAPYQYLPGMIIGVQPYQLLESDYSVHFRFDRLMQQEQLKIIRG